MSKIERFGCGCVGIRMPTEDCPRRILLLWSCSDDGGITLTMSKAVLEKNLEPGRCRELTPDEITNLTNHTTRMLYDGERFNMIQGMFAHAATRPRLPELHFPEPS